MNIDPLSQLGIQPEENAPSQELGRDEFLKMLIAQLENQDPINPQDASEFTAQLAQFSTLEQLLAMTEGLEEVAEAQRAFSGTLQGLASTELIGREIVAGSDQLQVKDGLFASMPAIDLEGPATQVRLEILDAEGNVRQSLDLGAKSAGFSELEDGIPSALGLRDGIYSFRVEAFSGEESVAARTFVTGRVSGALPTGEETFLEVGELVLPYANVSEIRK